MPRSDLSADNAILYLAESNGHLVGVAGMQVAGSIALLRSVAVMADFRGGGIARRLVGFCEATAKDHNISALYLIANDAAALKVFIHLGYRLIERGDVPSAMLSLSEFSHLCPASYPCLCKLIAGNFARHSR